MTYLPTPSRGRSLAITLGALFLGGCATFSQDGGFGSVESIAKQRIDKEVKWVRSDADADSVKTEVKKLLAAPLSVDSAVQIALFSNKGLQASYAELGISEANLVQAGRLRNPGLSYSRASDGSDTKSERSITFDLLQLLTMPLALEIEGKRFEQTKLRVTSEMLGIAAETQRTYYMAVAAEQTARYMEQVKMSAEAGAELARRMARAGNWSKLDQAREQVFYAEATAQLAKAKGNAGMQRERLTRLLGLWGNDVGFKLPQRLPELPAVKPELNNIEAIAVAQRLDIQAAKRDTEALAESLGLTKTTRFINVLEVGDLRTTATAEPNKKGYSISLEVPIFDWGTARVARAEALYMQAVNRLAETAINARSEVRVTYSVYLIHYELAKHYRDEVVPLRKKISDENLLRYNGMLISVFELLADAREQIIGVNGYIEALKEFWVADADMKMALGGSLTASASPPAGQERSTRRQPSGD